MKKRMQAAELVRRMVVIDSHIDLPFRLQLEPSDLSVRSDRGHFDAVRAREGGLDAAFLAIFVPSYLQERGGAREHADRMLDEVEELLRRWPELFRPARTPGELRAAHREGRIALALALENAAPIDCPADLRHFFDRGIRYITLTHFDNNQICDSSMADRRRWGGLSPLGRELVVEMNRIGMMVDVSHASDAACDQILEISRVPVIASHSSCRHFTPGFERNLDDSRIRRLAAGGGVVQINFGSAFLNPTAQIRAIELWSEILGHLTAEGWEWSDPAARAWVKAHRRSSRLPESQLSEVADHIEHAVQIAGIEHVGLGSDFDGVDALPVGLEDVSKYPALFDELLERGFSERHIGLIAGENLLRVWAEVEDAAEAS